MDDWMQLFTEPLVAINVGGRDFGIALEDQGAQVAYVEWAPPAGGDPDLIDLLDQLL